MVNEISEMATTQEENTLTSSESSSISTENNDPYNEQINDLHPIELAAHSILSPSLDHLHDNFQSLNRSQLILFTRLQLIEKRLKSIEEELDDNDHTNAEKIVERIHGLKKILQNGVKTLKKVELKVNSMESQL